MTLAPNTFEDALRKMLAAPPPKERPKRGETEMQPNDVPVGQKAIITDAPHIKVIFDRTSETGGVMEHFDPSTGKLVLRVTYLINGSSIDILYADPDFWTFKADGKQVRPPLSFAYQQVSVDPPSRTINFRLK